MRKLKNVGNTGNLSFSEIKQSARCLANMCVLERHTRACTNRQTQTHKHTHTHTLKYIEPRAMLFHSAQKSCQEATWEFSETEIELVLTQAEQRAVAETWIIVPYKVLAARRTWRHVCHHTSSLKRCLWTVVPKDLFIGCVFSQRMFTSTIELESQNFGCECPFRSRNLMPMKNRVSNYI